MSNELKCEYCGGMRIKPGIFDKKCKCNNKAIEETKNYKSNDLYLDGLIDGIIIDDMIESIFDD